MACRVGHMRHITSRAPVRNNEWTWIKCHEISIGTVVLHCERHNNRIIREESWQVAAHKYHRKSGIFNAVPLAARLAWVITVSGWLDAGRAIYQPSLTPLCHDALERIAKKVASGINPVERKPTRTACVNSDGSRSTAICERGKFTFARRAEK